MNSNAYFDRGFLKARAKETLRLSYWKAFIASLVLSVSLGGSNSAAGARMSSQRSSFHITNPGSYRGFQYYADPLAEWAAAMLPMFIGVAFIAAIIGIVIAIMVLSPLEVGAQRYFLESTQQRFNLGELGFGFAGGGYSNVVKTQFFRGLFTMLWFLLLVIPGIIKSYAYSMTPFILAENPNLPSDRAITLSREMTRGFRWQMFVFDLSFMGWYLLGAMFFGVGVMFVAPYYNTTKAELYLFLRTRAIDLGLTSSSELSRGRAGF